ncbi:hypothetical protein N7519_010932 [Penicillium mononematosum]|uniref:uncharacterized protein n=1 Tax=Penicillium mononematosum TaxID=268346 RepID=UPI002547BD2D|nr:uncharacterized protein N7519_010932 [Penicillium mononematosum]KAJ6180471.1 hypothetical protein N7519_010932 [Penicillium mononematosum]
MTTRTAPRGLRVLVSVGWAKPVRIAGQGHPHAKPALKCEMRDVAYMLSWHWRYAAFESLASAWLPSRVAFYPSELGPSWGAAAFVLPITRKMRDGDAGVYWGVHL